MATQTQQHELSHHVKRIQDNPDLCWRCHFNFRATSPKAEFKQVPWIVYCDECQEYHKQIGIYPKVKRYDIVRQ